MKIYSRKILLLSLLSTVLLFGKSTAQKGKNNTDKSITTINFDCSNEPCIFTINGTFGNDISTLKSDKGELFSGYDFNIENINMVGDPNPLAYVSSQPNAPTFISVVAEFSTLCETLPNKVGIRGTNAEGYDFEPKELDVNVNPGTGSSFIFSAESTEQIPDNQVNMFDLDITWEINKKGQATWGNDDDWETVGLSKNRVYVTWKEPKPESGSKYSHLETTFFLGCKHADGATDKDQIITSIWESGFKNADVKNADGEPLHYYKDWMTDNQTAASLLGNEDGMCYSWVHLFLDAIKIQGVDYQGYELRITSKLDDADGFFVNNWDFLEKSNMLENHPSPGVQNILSQGFQYLATFKSYDEAYNYIGNTYKFLYKDEVVELTGKAGQNTDNPLAIFNIHAAALINGKVYDPNYGDHSPIDFNNGGFINDFENANIAGHYKFAPVSNVDEYIVNQDINGDGEITSNSFCYFFFIKKQVNVDNDLNVIQVAY